MASWALIGIAASIAVIATAVSVMVAIALHWPAEIAALVGLLVFIGLCLVQLMVGRGGGRADEPEDASRLDALEQTMGDLLDRVEAVAQRQRGVDNALIERVRTATEPLVQEIGLLSERLTELAEDLAAREETAGSDARRPAPRPPAPPVLPRAASLPLPPAGPPIGPPAPAPRAEPVPPPRAELLGPPTPPVARPPAPPRIETPPTRVEPPPALRVEPPPPPLRAEPPPPRTEPPQARAEPARPPEPVRAERPAPPAPPALPPKAFDSPFQIPKRPSDTPLPMRPAAKRAAAPIQRQPAAPDPADVERAAQLREALAGGRYELYLEQIVRLPSRRLSHYETILRLRDARNAVIEAPDVFAAADRAGLTPELDRAAFEGAAVLLRRLAAAGRATSAMLCLSPASLAEGGIMTRLADLAREDASLAEHLVLQMPQAAWTTLPPTEADKVAALADIGFRFSIDRLTHMRLDGRELSRRGVRFVKLPAALLLDPKAAATSPIHPNDLAGLLDRNGVTLIVDRIEQEATVATLLEIGVKFAQGPIFGEPRPMRIEVPAEVDDSPPPTPPPPAAPRGGKSPRAGGARSAPPKPRS